MPANVTAALPILLTGAALALVGCRPSASADSAPSAVGTALGELAGAPVPGGPALEFAPDVISDGRTFSSAFTPDGRTLFTTRFTPDRSRLELAVSHLVGGKWTAPEPFPHTAGYNAADPFVSPDGRHLYFSWAHPQGAAADTAPDYDTWVADRTADGWSAPRPYAPEVHTEADEMYPSLTRGRTLYFDSRQAAPGLEAPRNLFTARWTGTGYAEAEPLPASINGGGGGSNPYVDPDERFIIFASRRPGGAGASDLYIAYRAAAGWGAPIRLGPRVNTRDAEFCPQVSPDGRYLFFSRITYDGTRRVGEDVHWISIDVLPPPPA